MGGGGEKREREKDREWQKIIFEIHKLLYKANILYNFYSLRLIKKNKCQKKINDSMYELKKNHYSVDVTNNQT